MDDVETPYGTFHSGFFKAGAFVYESVKDLINNCNEGVCEENLELH